MIHKKLLEFQKQNIKVSKTGTNPHFNSSYATLNEVLDKVKEPLNKLGILIIQAPEATGLRTTLLDLEDDTKVECFMPYVEIGTAQKLGSNNTYLRRYSLVTLLGLEDEDDDGNKASVPPQKPHSGVVLMPRGVVANPTQNSPVVCKHDEPAVKRTSKSAANPGREFYACAKPKSEQCQFFLWADELYNQTEEDDFNDKMANITYED